MSNLTKEQENQRKLIIEIKSDISIFEKILHSIENAVCEGPKEHCSSIKNRILQLKATVYDIQNK